MVHVTSFSRCFLYFCREMLGFPKKISKILFLNDLGL
jgi:hypothetical protein